MPIPASATTNQTPTPAARHRQSNSGTARSRSSGIQSARFGSARSITGPSRLACPVRRPAAMSASGSSSSATSPAWPARPAPWSPAATSPRPRPYGRPSAPTSSPLRSAGRSGSPATTSRNSWRPGIVLRRQPTPATSPKSARQPLTSKITNYGWSTRSCPAIAIGPGDALGCRWPGRSSQGVTPCLPSGRKETNRAQRPTTDDHGRCDPPGLTRGVVTSWPGIATTSRTALTVGGRSTVPPANRAARGRAPGSGVPEPTIDHEAAPSWAAPRSVGATSRPTYATARMGAQGQQPTQVK